VGQLFANSGWEVIFLDVAAPLIDALNSRKSYTITVKDDLPPGQPSHIEVKNVSGVNLSDRQAVVDTLVRADLIGTSVGAANLEAASGLVAEALLRRSRPVSLILCENLHGAAKITRDYLTRSLPPTFPLAERLGLVEAAIGKMVPYTPLEVRKNDPLAVWAEAYNTLYLDAESYLGSPPTVFGVAWRQRFPAYVDRKLMLHNFAHAATAYHGYLAGKSFIWEAIRVPEVRQEVVGCMLEVSRALAIRHADVFTFDENRATADDLIRRFNNPALADPVFRVGRDLKRKFSPGDRCLGSLRLLRETGIPGAYSARAVAAGMLFGAVDETGKAFPGDPELVELAKRQGPEAVLTSIGGLDGEKDQELIKVVEEEYRRLATTSA
jgi:mannitol-1-phosphate 5-dehydrogenase